MSISDVLGKMRHKRSWTRARIKPLALGKKIMMSLIAAPYESQKNVLNTVISIKTNECWSEQFQAVHVPGKETNVISIAASAVIETYTSLDGE